MEQTGSHNSGWSFVAETDGAAALLGTILDLDPDESYTRSELANAADVPLKELYLSDALSKLADIGILESVGEDGGEATYEIVAESPIYEAAVAFDEAIDSQTGTD